MAGTGHDPAYTAGRYGDAAVTFAHPDEDMTDNDDDDDDAYSDEWTDEAGVTPRGHDAHHHQHEAATGHGAAGVVNPAGGQGFQFQWTTFDDEDHPHGPPPPPTDPRTAAAGGATRHFAAGGGGDAATPGTPPAGHARGAGPHHHHHHHHGGHDAGHMPMGDDDDEDEQMMDDEGQEGGGNFDEDYEPTDAEILDYCEWLGVDPTADRPLMWIVREALKAPLPEHWRLCYTDDRELYYFNVHTGESIWDHPLDAFYKALYKQEKAKLLKKRQCMRHFSGSLDLQPLAHFFSELGDDEGTPFDEVDSQSNAGASSSPPVEGATASRRPAPWAAIPEALIDAIDFRIFVEPVVLPTSGRTVSRHTIINTRWRDPFSREYVENRRLVPNVDKRAEVDAWLGNAVGHFFDHLEVSVEGLRRALRILPYLLDKEEEMCLRGQRRFFDWVKRNHSEVEQQRQRDLDGKAQESRSEAPSSARSSNAASEKPSRTSASVRGSGGTAQGGTSHSNGTMRKSSKARLPAPAGSNATRGAGAGAAGKASGLGATQGSKTTPTTTPRRVPSILAMIKESLTDVERGTLVSALLTMATSTSRECLFYIVSNLPSLAKHEAFKGFADEVLHMLYVGAPDLARIAQSIADVVAKRREELAAAERSANDGTPAADPGFGASTGPGMTSGAWGASWVAGQPPSASNATFQSGSSGAAAIGLGAANPSAPGSRGGDGGGVNANANSRATPTDLQAALFVSYGTSNSEQVSALQWVAGLQEHADVNALAKLDFASMLHIVFAVSDSAQVAATGSTVTKLLRSATNWPSQLSQCPDEAIMKLYAVASTDEVPATRVRTLFDAAWSGGERCLEFFRQPDVRQSTLDAMLELAPPASELSRAYVAGNDGDQSPDLFSAILVYHDCLSLEQLKCRPALALRVGYNLLPRLTRSQWRPKHFDTTVGTILSLTQQHPALAWRTMQSAGALFLLKELSKKKRNAEETRLKLGGLEAVERRHQQTNAINNWGLLASRLMRRTAKSVCEVVSSQDTSTAAAAPAPAPVRGAPAAAGTVGPSGRTRLPHVAPRPSPRGQPAKDAAHRAPAPPPPPPAVPPGLQRVAAQVERYEANVARLSTRREELHAERAQTIITALQTLVAMRLKPKASRLPAGSKKHGSTDEADRAGAIPPPISARRSSGSGRPPSGPSNGGRRVGGGSNEPGGVASSCPSLPPIAPTH